MSTLTYDQAVTTYKKRAQTLEKKFRTLSTDITGFLRNARKYVEKKDRASEERLMATVEKRLKEVD